jgi:hypothetical protein
MYFRSLIVLSSRSVLSGLSAPSSLSVLSGLHVLSSMVHLVVLHVLSSTSVQEATTGRLDCPIQGSSPALCIATHLHYIPIM